MTTKACNELLSDRDGFVARCTMPWGVEHSHHDHTAREAVAAGIAREGYLAILPVASAIDGPKGGEE